MDLDNAITLLYKKLEKWLEGFIASLPNLVIAILLVVGFYFLGRLLRKFSKKVFANVIKNPAIEGLLANLIFAVIFITGILVSLGILNLNKTLTSLLAGAGIIGLALSFAFQDIAQNFISGVSMAIWRPFNIGDIIETGGRRGTVKKLNLRTTHLINAAGELLIVPNKEIHQNVLINCSTGEGVLIRIALKIPRDEDPEHIRELIISSLEDQPHVIRNTVDVFFTHFTGAEIRGETRFFVDREEDDAKAKSKAIIALKKTFESNQVKIS